jgi:hypothetical protein
MLTFFAVPKPFRGHTAVIQENALRSWRAACPDCEILLLGDDEGVAEAASRHAAVHLPDLQKTDSGIPRVDDVFRRSIERARYNIVCYVNADILLFGDLPEAVRRLRGHRPYFATGRRTNLDVTEPVEASGAWVTSLRQQAREYGTLSGAEALDYFVFLRGTLDGIPPFALGRTVWDNWLAFHAWRTGLDIIDLTPSVMVIHQNHDYTHAVADGQKQAVWASAEAERNRRLQGDPFHFFTVMDARYVLGPDGLRRPFDFASLRRRGRHITLRYPWLRRTVESVWATVGVLVSLKPTDKR